MLRTAERQTMNCEWYTHARWRKKRKRQLQLRPLCEWCDRRGLTVVAEVAHHTTPHRGDRVKFWNGQLVSLCKKCHDADAQLVERGGKPKPTIGANGWPIE